MAGLGSAAVQHCGVRHARTPRCVAKGRIQCSDTWSGEGSRSVSQSAGQLETNSVIATVRLPKIVSIPIADVFEEGSQCLMLYDIVTGLRHLPVRLASMRVSQASVAEMLQTLRGLCIPRAYNEKPAAFQGRTIVFAYRVRSTASWHTLLHRRYIRTFMNCGIVRTEAPNHEA